MIKSGAILKKLSTKKRLMFFILATVLAGSAYADNNHVNVDIQRIMPTLAHLEKAEAMKIKLTLGNRVLTASMNSSEAARDFMALLPLTLTLDDYAGTEKISNLPKRLSVTDSPAGSKPSVGDIAYYAPWGNLAIFYKDFAYSNGLVILGKIDGGAEALQTLGSVKVTIEIAD